MLLQQAEKKGLEVIVEEEVEEEEEGAKQLVQR